VAGAVAHDLLAQTVPFHPQATPAASTTHYSYIVYVAHAANA
jgi:hypothetical protein